MSRDPRRQLREAWIIEAVRTPIGRYGGALARRRADHLPAGALAALPYRYRRGETAENVAERWEVGRELQDAFSLASQQKAVAAIEAGRFDSQIVPIQVPQRKGESVSVTRDEHPRADTSAEALARLRPAFRDGGTVTAGNASGINDGASAVLLVEADRARELGLQPMARGVSTAVPGVDPAAVGIRPSPATRKALGRAGRRRAGRDLADR